MAVTATPYAAALGALGRGELNFDGDTFKAMVTTAAYVPNYDTDAFVSDVTDEVSGSGYFAGGATLSGLSWAYDTSDASNKRWVLHADPILWSGVTWTGGRRLVVYRVGSAPAVSQLIGVIDWGVDKSPASEDFQQSFTAGLLRIKAI